MEGDYKIGTVPAGGLLLVGGADVQKDRIEASVWAFGVGKESWLIEHRVLMGDTARDEVWKRLQQMLNETWTHESGASLPLVRFALDTGFATQEAYAFVRTCRDPRVMAVKGVARGAALIGTPTAVDVTQGGRKLRRGIKLPVIPGCVSCSCKPVAMPASFKLRSCSNVAFIIMVYCLGLFVCA